MEIALEVLFHKVQCTVNCELLATLVLAAAVRGHVGSRNPHIDGLAISEYMAALHDEWAGSLYSRGFIFNSA